MGDIDRSATVDVQIQAHALLGRVLWKTGGETGAAAEYARVRALYRDPAAVAAKLKAAGGDEGQDGRRLAKVLTAVGEAHLLLRRAEAEGGRRPQVPRVQGVRPARGRGGAPRRQGPRVDDEEAPGHRGGGARVSQDRRSPAVAAAALGHRLGRARGPDVGEVRRRAPRGAHPQGVAAERPEPLRRPAVGGDPRGLHRRDRPQERALPAAGQGGLSGVPGGLVPVPVLRRAARARASCGSPATTPPSSTPSTSCAARPRASGVRVEGSPAPIVSAR